MNANEMNELYEDMMETTPEMTNTYFTPSEDDLEAMFAEMGDE